MHETMARSCLGDLKTGSLVNLERAMAADGRFGGHIVSGHIDGTGTISMIRQDGNAVWYTVEAPPGILLYIVEKGSIAMDGISLTVARVTDHDFSVSVIPHTIRHTTLGAKRASDRVNLENDCVGKYIGKLLGASSFSQDKVSRAGFTRPGGPQPNISRAGISQSHCAGTITRDFLTKYGF